MLPQLPFLAFSPAMEARDVWKNTPIIFLAILDVAADGFCELEVSRNLRKLLVQIYSTCFLGATAYNLSLLQAFIISAAWHRAIEPPQPGEHTDVHQISHAAASMAIIMGLGKSPKTQTRSGPMPVQERKLYGPASTYDSTSLEARRIWLGCHYVCSNTSMALQTPNVMRWTRYTDECLEILDTSPASLPSDKALCHHVRLQHILEEYELRLYYFVDGPTEAGIAHGDFRRQLADWTSAPRVWSDPLRFSQKFVALYMHEIAMHSAPIVDQPPGSGGDAVNIDPAEFTDCLAAAHGLLDIFLSLDMSLIRALPTLYFVRLTYAAVVLVKLHFAATRLPDPRDAAQKIASLKVDEYLRRMLQTFSGWGTLWPARRLTKVLRRIREMFRQRGNRDMMATELSWLNLWSLKQPQASESAPAEQVSGAESATAMQNITDPRQDRLEIHPTDIAGGSASATQTLPTTGTNGPVWPNDTSLLYTMDEALPSLAFEDTLCWGMNMSTFDFDGDLQAMIQNME